MSALPRFLVLDTALMSMLLTPAFAGGAYSGANGHGAALPDCAAPSVRRTIASADTEYREAIAIKTIDLIGQTGFTQDNPSPLAHRYCRARAYLSNGRQHPVYYMIEERAGFVWLSWNTETCLPGYDRWHVHDGQCRVVRR
ncbi:hypothetical protein [Breoghania sp.]|uniref:hypothetical protein n=1 Tax=Breoghania sp. TaxID=2065378 RepID=UPI0026162DAE|nr:hypothetical protein [Breoghania sp.]MDJ0931543.1 hypothetical protein [Breoghania sp.]